MRSVTGKVELRTMSHSDIPDLLRLTDAEGWGFVFSDIERILRMGSEESVVACIDGEIVGAITGAVYGNKAVLCHVVVREGYRRKGIGQMIMSSVLDRLDKSGTEKIEVFAETKAERFYVRNGFKRIEEISFIMDDLVPGRYPPIKDERIRGLVISDIGLMEELDFNVIGFNRGTFLRDVMTDFPEHILGLFEGEELRGYIQSRKTTVSFDLGPWILKNPRKEDAMSMLFAALAKLPNTKGFIFVPSSNRLSLEILRDAGFAEKTKLLRMVRSEGTVSPFSPSVMMMGGTEVG